MITNQNCGDRLQPSYRSALVYLRPLRDIGLDVVQWN